MLEELRTFVEVVENKNFTKAALNLSISQPTVSLHIKRLELVFEKRLIIRSKKQKKIIITSSGEKLYLQARKLLEIWEYTQKIVKEDTDIISGSINVGASLTIGEYFLPEFLGKFHSRYPKININIELGNTQKISEELKNYRIDAAIVEGVIVDESFIKEHLYQDDLVLIAPENYVSDPWDKSTRWIVREKGSGTRMQWEYIIGENLSNLECMPLTMNTNFAVKEAVKNNIGIALISEYIARLAQDTNEVKILENEIKGSRYFDLLLQKERSYDKSIIVFCEELKKYFKNKQNEIKNL